MKPHEPNDKDRKLVESMAGYGTPELGIARVLGISVPTLRKYYMEQLNTGGIKANAQVAQSLFNKALGNGAGAVTACIFWLKVRAGWVEQQFEQQQPGKKELQAEAAQMAGGINTQWSGDLDFDQRPN